MFERPWKEGGMLETPWEGESTPSPLELSWKQDPVLIILGFARSIRLHDLCPFWCRLDIQGWVARAKKIFIKTYTYYLICKLFC